jgi:hypothetical protein
VNLFSSGLLLPFIEHTIIITGVKIAMSKNKSCEIIRAANKVWKAVKARLVLNCAFLLPNISLQAYREKEADE